jgi:hypothetical protein
MTSWPYSRSCRTASIRSGRAGGLAGELPHLLANEASPQTDEACRIGLPYHSGGFGSLIDAFQTTVKRQLGSPRCF